MKKFLLYITFLTIALSGYSQIQDPVSWTFTSKKVDAKTYEVHLVAVIGTGWHIYSQTTPEGGPVPTSISFVKNPLISLGGAVKESGKLQQHNEPLFGVDVKQYSDKVDFVQIIKLKTAVKTQVSGGIEFMVCNDKQCLPPKTVRFNIQLK